jgi:hypothetical protein
MALPVAVLPAYHISVKVNYSVNIVEDNLETHVECFVNEGWAVITAFSIFIFVTTSHLAIT